MTKWTAIAISSSNIAFIKYWGNRDSKLRIPANGSISMNLDGLTTRTRVSFDPTLSNDRLTLNEQAVSGPPLQRVSVLLERVRAMANIKLFADVQSENNFPAGVGIASSASAFAALSLAAAAAAGLDLSEKDLSRLGRTGSGSACRSIPGGFVEWQAGQSDNDSYAYSIAPPDYWDLVDCIAIVSENQKSIGSYKGNDLADTSPLQTARVADAPRRLDICRQAILTRDFSTLAEIIELDCHLMHAVMMTSAPRLFYWQPPTLDVIHTVIGLRKGGFPVCYTIDAGPNVHCFTPAPSAEKLGTYLIQIQGVTRVLNAHPGGPTRLES